MSGTQCQPHDNKTCTVHLESFQELGIIIRTVKALDKYKINIKSTDGHCFSDQPYIERPRVLAHLLISNNSICISVH